MIRVILNSPGYSYDVHSLVKAFYPESDVKVLTDDTDKIEGSQAEPLLVVWVSEGDIPKDTRVTGYLRVQYEDGKSVDEEEADFEDKDRGQVKNLLKITLYKLLERITGRSLPWGTLTGIRPTKIPMKMILEGKDDSCIVGYLEDNYLCSSQKAGLATEIAHREKEITSLVALSGYSLYIGIPFCPTTCLYCSFTSYPIGAYRKRVEEYIKALKKEIDFTAQLYRGLGPDSVYMGGGTPTTLEADELRDLISYLKEKIPFDRVKEFTVEAGRPDSITREKLETLYEMGVTRISINPQTMNDETLRIIGRRHTVADVYAAYDLARSTGFTNINMDIILGLPGEDLNNVMSTLNKIEELSPDSLTVHSMAIKRAAGMHQYLSEHEEIKSVNTPEMMEEAIGAAGRMGLVPYYLYRQKNMTGNLENIGFAKEGKFGIYNILIMEEVQSIVALGAGTVTKKVTPGDGDGGSFSDAKIDRCDNVKDVNLYIEKIDEMIDRKKRLFL